MLSIDLDFNVARFDGREVRLTRNEAELLYALSLKRLARYDYLAHALWGLSPDAPKDEQENIKIYVHRLRRKLKIFPVAIGNVRGRGYYLRTNAASAA